MDIAKFLRTAFFIEHLRWLLLTVLQQYSKVSWGVCYSLISRLPCIFDFDQKLTQNVAQILSCGKTMSSLLELIVQVLSISENVLEKH